MEVEDGAVCEGLGVDGPASLDWALRAAARCMNLRLRVPVDSTMLQ